LERDWEGGGKEGCSSCSRYSVYLLVQKDKLAAGRFTGTKEQILTQLRLEQHVLKVSVDGDELALLWYNGYELKDRLRAVGFRWLKDLRCWGMRMPLPLLSSLFSACSEVSLGNSKAGNNSNQSACQYRQTDVERSACARMTQGGSAEGADHAASATAACAANVSYSILQDVKAPQDTGIPVSTGKTNAGDSTEAQAESKAQKREEGEVDAGADEVDAGAEASGSIGWWRAKISEMGRMELLQKLEHVQHEAGGRDANSAGGLAQQNAPRLLSPNTISTSEGGSDGWPSVPPVPAPAPAPILRLKGKFVTIGKCYEIKDSLRSRGFRWDTQSKVWVQHTSAVLSLLGVTDVAHVTLEAILQAKPLTKALAAAAELMHAVSQDPGDEEGSEDDALESRAVGANAPVTTQVF